MSQLDIIRQALFDGEWHTIPSLWKKVMVETDALCMQTSISARIRDLRKEGREIISEPTGPARKLYRYRMVVEEQGRLF